MIESLNHKSYHNFYRKSYRLLPRTIQRWNWARGTRGEKNLARASADAKISQVGMGNFGGPGCGAKVAKVLYLCRKVGPRQVGVGRFGRLGRGSKVAKVLYLCRNVGLR